MKSRIMVLDDQIETLELIQDVLAAPDRRISCFSDPTEGLTNFKREGADIILTDLRMPKLNGIEVLQSVKKHNAGTQVILMTAHGEVDNAVRAMKLGATDFLRKPLCVPELITSIAHIQELHQLRERLDVLAGGSIVPVGCGAAMKKVFSMVRSVAETDCTVLLTGETGVGKEVLADYIQSHSARVKGPFIKVNCAALPENLLESEMFGHEKGAFTGAAGQRIGRFELAHQGTLFLDEIGELPQFVQVKLLRVLQTREIERIGSTKPIVTNFRLICATHRDLHSLIREGKFREDLYFRINIFPIHIPPLRDRAEDLPALAYHFLKRARSKIGRGPLEIHPNTLNVLAGHTWPGNVRELENAIERASVVATGSMILPHHLGSLYDANSAVQVNSVKNELESLHGNGDLLPVPHAVPWNFRVADPLAEAERITLVLVLEDCQWNFRDAANRLNMSRSTLYAKVTQHGIKRGMLP